MSRRFPKDSILFVSIGSTIGKCGLAPVELTSNQQINAIFPSTSFASEYLYYAVSAAASRIKAQAGEQAVPIVNKTQFSHTGIAFPSFSEQRAIAAALSDADAWIESLEKLIEKQRAVKQGAMQALLTPPGQPGHQRLPGFKGAWEVKRLGEVVSPRTDRLDPTSVTDTTFCVELEHMISGTGMLTNDAGITGGSSLKSIFHPGDVLYGKLRAYLRKFWFADRPGVCSTEIWVLAADTLILRPEYLYQVVKSNFFLDATNTTYGTHMPRSDWNVVRELKLALPTLPEQSAIATVLSDLDAEVEALEAKLAKARQIKQGMMQELLTGRVRLV
jgi:type I restriction enzyme S subunit